MAPQEAWRQHDGHARSRGGGQETRPWRWLWSSRRRETCEQGRHAAVRVQRHCGRVQLEARACAAARCSDTRGGSCLWMMCAPQGAPCRGAGGLWVRSGEHAAIAKERAVRMPCYRAARIRTPPRPQRLGGKLLGFRHTARRRLRRAVCVKQSGAGVAGAGCDGAESAADAVSAAPPSGKCGGGAWPWAAHPREAIEERVPSSRGSHEA